jgi:hypothetical protein
MRHLGGSRANDRRELAEPTVGVTCGTFRRHIIFRPAIISCQQTELTFLWRSLPFANCMIPLWRNEGQVEASIDMAFIFMATCGMHLSHPQLLLD